MSRRCFFSMNYQPFDWYRVTKSRFYVTLLFSAYSKSLVGIRAKAKDNLRDSL